MLRDLAQPVNKNWEEDTTSQTQVRHGMKSQLWNCPATSIGQAKTPSLKSLHITVESLYLHEEDRCKMYVKIHIYGVLNYSFHRSLLKRSVRFPNELPEKAAVTKISTSFQNKNRKSIHTKLNALNLCQSYTIYSDFSSCVRLDVLQRKTWIRVGPPRRFESQNLIKILRKLIQVILQALWKKIAYT